ncbi:MAG: MATE family efflux transporter [Myxococcota bacterium]
MQTREAAQSIWRYRDHTQGSLLLSMLVLALPSIGTGIAGAAAYQLVDLWFVSSLGAAPLAAVVVTNQSLRQAAFLLVMGSSVVAQMMMARFVGEERVERAEHVAGQVLVLGGGLCLIFALIGGLFPGALLRSVTQDPDVLEVGVPYVRLIFLLMFGFVMVPLFAAVLGGAGDSTTPMVISLVATPVSLFAEWCLIFGHLGFPAFGIQGVALGSTLGALAAVSIGLWALLSGRCRVHLKAAHLVPDPRMLGLLVRLSWRPSLQLAGRTLVIIYFMAIAGRFGAEVQAAYGIGIRLEMVVFMVAFPVANACATLVGQNLGAGSRRRAWRAVWVATGAELAICGTFAVLFAVFREDFVGFFTTDRRVVDLGSEYLLFMAGNMLIVGPHFVAFRTLQAAGDLTSPMLFSNGSALLVAIPLGHYLALHTALGPTGLWIAVLTHGLINGALTLSWLATGRWTQRHFEAVPPAGP